MKKALSFLTVMLFTGVAFAQYNTKVHFVPGGSELVAESGATVTVKSGGSLVVEAGATVNQLSLTYGLAAATAAFSSTIDVNGQATFGADNTVSTIPAAGSPSFHGTLTAGILTSAAGVNGVNAAFSGTLDADGQSTLGAHPTVSTVTTTGAATFYASVGVPTTGMVFVGLRTIAQLMAATAVLGEIGICSNCAPVEVFISTGTGAPNTGGYATGAGLQLN